MASSSALGKQDLVLRLQIGKSLGSGAFATVHRAVYDGQPVALKVLQPQHVPSAKGDCPVKMFIREGEMLRRLDHGHIVRCLAVLEIPPGFPGLGGGYTQPTWALVLELLEGGSLGSLLYKQLVAPWKFLYDNVTALEWSTQIASALAHLHGLSPPAIHRDVKAENVMLSRALGRGQEAVAKVVDLGLHTRPLNLERCTRQTLLRGPMSRSCSSLHIATSRPGGERIAGSARALTLTPNFADAAANRTTAGGQGTGAAAACASSCDGGPDEDLEIEERSKTLPNLSLFFAVNGDGNTPYPIDVNAAHQHTYYRRPLSYEGQPRMPHPVRQLLPSSARGRACAGVMVPMGNGATGLQARQAAGAFTQPPPRTLSRCSGSALARPSAGSAAVEPSDIFRLSESGEDDSARLGTPAHIPTPDADRDLRQRRMPPPSICVIGDDGAAATQLRMRGDAGGEASRLGSGPPADTDRCRTALRSTSATSTCVPTVAADCNYLDSAPRIGRLLNSCGHDVRALAPTPGAPAGMCGRGDSDAATRVLAAPATGTRSTLVARGQQHPQRMERPHLSGQHYMYEGARSRVAGAGGPAARCETSSAAGTSPRTGDRSCLRGDDAQQGHAAGAADSSGVRYASAPTRRAQAIISEAGCLAHASTGFPSRPVTAQDISLSGMTVDGSLLEVVYRLTGETGSCMTMAPEIRLQQPYNEKIDVYAFGIVLYEIWSRSLLAVSHIGTHRPDLPRVLHKCTDWPDLIVSGYRPARVQAIPDPLWELINECWDQDPLRRPTMSDVEARLRSMAEQEAVVGLSSGKGGRKRAAAAGQVANQGCGCTLS